MMKMVYGQRFNHLILEINLEEDEINALAKATLSEFESYIKSNKKIPAEIFAEIAKNHRK